MLTHWGRVTHICVSKLPIISSDNGLSPGRRQAIIWTNAGILLIGPLWTNFSEILIEIPILSFKKMRLKESSAKWRPCCLGLNVLTSPNCLVIVTKWLIQRQRQNIYGLIMEATPQAYGRICRGGNLKWLWSPVWFYNMGYRLWPCETYLDEDRLC